MGPMAFSRGGVRGKDLLFGKVVVVWGSDQEVSSTGTEKVANAGRGGVSGRGFLRMVPPQFGQTVKSIPVNLSKSFCQVIRGSSVGRPWAIG